jgi:outer membrane protein assembly factor BamB
MTLKRIAAGLSLSAIIGLIAAAGVEAQNWPQWRGPNRDGAIAAFNEPKAWPDQLRQQWRIDVGLGYATPLLVGDRIYMFTRQGEDEVMQALDAATGKTIWRTAYAAPFSVFAATARHGAGPKSTPAFANGRLFSFGMSSIVTAYDAATGKQLWQKPATARQPMYHTAMSPIVEGNTVIIHVGGPDDSAFAAYDVATGAVRWEWKGDSPAYGSPIVAEFGGTRQVVAFTHQNLVGISAANGQLLWRRPFTTPSNTTSQTPIAYRDSIIQAGREAGITRFRILQKDGNWVTENLWSTKEVSLQMSNAVEINGVLYGLSHFNSGQYFALDLESGQVLWRSDPRQAENTAMVRAGDTIFSLENDAELVVMKADKSALNIVKRYTVANGETWTQPAISGNRFFVKGVSDLTLWTLN